MSSYVEMCFFQHKILPYCFYHYRSSFAIALLEDGNFIYQLTNGLFDEEDENEAFYTEEDFSCGLVYSEYDINVIMIEYPSPEREPLCYSAFLFFDVGFEKPLFITIESSFSSSDEQSPLICSWIPDENGGFLHFIYHRCGFDREENFFAAMAIYKKKFQL